MKKINVAHTAWLLWMGIGMLCPAKAATIQAPSCSYADISAAVLAASPGDVITVPSGQCTWNSQLTITKGISLLGAGIGRTVIVSNVGPGANENTVWLIEYYPTVGNLGAGEKLFRLSGFTFDFNFNSSGISLHNQNRIPSPAPITLLRVDHNQLKNSAVGNYYTLVLNGNVYGVLDHNIFGDLANPHQSVVIQTYGDNTFSWNYFPFAYGTANNFYFEDNIFYSSNTPHAGGAGGREVIRYNTYNAYGSSRLSPWIDAHGNQYKGNTGMMGVEIYGNLLNDISNRGALLFDHRGGKALMFSNKMVTTTNSNSTRPREEFVDEIMPVNSVDGEPQHVNDSYYWNNRQENSNTHVQTLISCQIDDITKSNCCSITEAWQPNTAYPLAHCAFITDPGADGKCFRVRLDGTSGPALPTWSKVLSSDYDATDKPGHGITEDGTVEWVYMDDGTPIAENKDFFNQISTFNGTSGMGCGPLSSRPSSCSPGVGYWATEQACDNLGNENVGRDAAVPISGALYKCTSTNTWTLYYTPYTYPHPLTLLVPDDSSAPVRTAGRPSGVLPAGTQEATLALTTDETANCKYSTTSHLSFGTMPSYFSTTGNTAHQTNISGLTDGSSYYYYVRCQDLLGNANAEDLEISFQVAQGNGSSQGSANGFLSFQNVFNPSRGEIINVLLNLPFGTHATLTVINRRGREIATLLDGSAGTNPIQATWNGKNKDGSVVASGVYTLMLKTNDFTQTKKIVVVK